MDLMFLYIIWRHITNKISKENKGYKNKVE